MSGNKNKVRAFAPATVANVACGFDVLGFAIHGPGDLVTAVRTAEPGIRIASISGDGGQLPLEVSRNTAGLAASALIRALKEPPGFGIALDIEKKMPLGSGLGSSAASSVAAVVAVNELLGKPFEKSELLPFAVEGEMATSGEPHADNAAASLLGGFILVRHHATTDVISLPVPEKLQVTIVHPHIEIQTKNSRMILKKEVPLAEAVQQWANLGSMVGGLYTRDYGLISRSLKDEIIEPVRSLLIPGFDEMKKAAEDAGVLGCSISGSGPSLFALSDSAAVAAEAGKKMSEILDNMGLESDVHQSGINTLGAHIL